MVLNCRGSLPEAAAYAAGPGAAPARDSRPWTPSWFRATGTREQVARLGLPRERVEVVPPLPPDARSRTASAAGAGGYALVAARLSEEKGVDVAIRAAALAGVPLRVAGDGPAAA